MERNSMRSAMLPGRSPEMANSFRRYLEGLLDPRDPSREYGAILPISSDPNVPGSGRFDLRGGFTGDILGMLGAGGRAMRGEAYDPMDITTGMVGMTLPNAMRRGARPPPSISVYHGSPHNFPAERLIRMPDGSTQYVVGTPDRLPDLPAGAALVRDYPHGRFRMSQMGTGEGNQAFGPGLYAAEAEAVGQSYKVPRGNRRPQELIDAETSLNDLFSRHRDLATDLDNAEQLIKSGRLGPQAAARIRENMTQTFNEIKAQHARVNELESQLGGKMYETRIRANPENFLDWDAIGTPAFKEPPALTRLVDAEMDKMKNVYDPADPRARRLVTEEVLRNPENLTVLRDAGIPGIRYYDATSRASSGKRNATRNYVVFDENLMDIVRKYGVAGLTMGGVAEAALSNATTSD